MTIHKNSTVVVESDNSHLSQGTTMAESIGSSDQHSTEEHIIETSSNGSFCLDFQSNTYSSLLETEDENENQIRFCCNT